MHRVKGKIQLYFINISINKRIYKHIHNHISMDSEDGADAKTGKRKIRLLSQIFVCIMDGIIRVQNLKLGRLKNHALYQLFDVEPIK